MQYVLVAAGLALLFLGGEFLVRGAVALARRLEVSPLIIGSTIVAFGTSAPELLVSLDANLSGAPGIALGNVVGSNIANILLILGCGALIFPIAVTGVGVRRNGVAVLAAAVLFVALAHSGAITPWAAILMLALLIGHTVYSYRASRGDAGSAEAALKAEGFANGQHPLWRSLGVLLAGLLGVVLGSHLLVIGAVELARGFGVSESTIGLTLVAVGTSLPELATTIVASYRQHSDVALGNVVGSNMFNVLGIMGIVPLFGAVPVPIEIARFDLWIMLGTTAALFGWVAIRRSIGRLAGATFLFGYLAYIASHAFGAPAITPL